jgi:6-phosphogluconolactonase
VRVTLAADASAAAQVAAGHLAQCVRARIKSTGRSVIALSGGRTPLAMLQQLAILELPWPALHVMQTDERIAPHGDAHRNLTFIEQILVERGPLPRLNMHAMPVEAADLTAAARDYQGLLESLCGTPAVLDVVHLGIGADGHTASLVPGDALLEVSTRDVGISVPYQGFRRMTLTVPAINRSRDILWLIAGSDKAARVAELVHGAGTTPALRIAREQALVIVDAAAAVELTA